VVERCIRADGARAVKRIVEISESGRAPKNDPAIFALAMAISLGDHPTKLAAGKALPKVCRIGTHLFHFQTYVEGFRGWGRMLKKAVQEWYQNRQAVSLVNQLVKYQQRDGVSHRDMLRLSHPKMESDAAIGWALGQAELGQQPYDLIQAFETAKTALTSESIVKLIQDFGLTREMIPTQWLNEATVWDAMLPNMGMTAMVRNLGNMTKVGLLRPDFGGATDEVVRHLRDQFDVKDSRIHPIQILSALLTYAQGKGFRGSNTWTPVTQVVDALDEAFYLSFGNVEPTDKRVVLGLDVSGSMHGTQVNGIPFLECYKACAAMSLIFLKAEKRYAPITVAFHTEPIPVTLSARQRLDDVTRAIAAIPTGGTDCAQPILWALENCIEADAFIVLTDSETWAGHIHPAQAIQLYRQKMNRPQTKLVTVAMAANKFTLSDPNDGGMMTCVGFDTSVPQLIQEFIRA
jgi:60 kDa SS-A/Ro ribonucleoprotein